MKKRINFFSRILMKPMNGYNLYSRLATWLTARAIKSTIFVADAFWISAFVISPEWTGIRSSVLWAKSRTIEDSTTMRTASKQRFGSSWRWHLIASPITELVRH
jgi:hypothetical protein